MNSQAIPEAAVEAAARGMHAEAHPPERWDSRPDHQQIYRARARTALEAAAPYLMAEAFDQGQKSGMRHADRHAAAARIGRPDLPGPISPNPYRPTP